MSVVYHVDIQQEHDIVGVVAHALISYAVHGPPPQGLGTNKSAIAIRQSSKTYPDA